MILEISKETQIKNLEKIEIKVKLNDDYLSRNYRKLIDFLKSD